jgi:AcrR family transcriptional regulator
MENTPEVDHSLFELFEFKPRKGDLKKMEIILAAIECISSIGFEKTTYESIAKRIGTRRAHIAYHFKDKDSIFESCIKLIMANYQQTSLKHIESAKTGEEMLVRYVEAPFIWAEENPSQLSVMLLFYYLCSINEKYQQMHADIRSGGAARIEFILTKKLTNSFSLKEARPLAKTIQNLVSGTIMDTATTKSKTLRQSKLQVKKQVLKLISQ